jgi:hypothetical protein
MCPEPQILSIYLDGELPSPWKEKLENHLKVCPVCKGKLENFKQLQELFRKDTSIRRTFVEKSADAKERFEESSEPLETAKNRVWRKLESKQRFKSGDELSSANLRFAGFDERQRSGVWQRKLSIPLPAVAAAAIIIALLTALWFRDGRAGRQADDKVNFILAEEEEMPGIIPTADMNGVLQYLTSDGADVIILRLPESSNFSRSGEPAIIRAADYSRRHP